MQSWDDARITVFDLESGLRKTLLEGGTYGRYASTGHLVYWRAGSLFAVPFDVKRLEVAGQAVPVTEGVAGLSYIGYADFAFAETGMLAYLPGGAENSNRKLFWVDRRGQAQPLAAPPKQYTSPRISPDGQRVAMGLGPLGSTDIWIYDLKRETLNRLTFQPASAYPAWTPDGKRISFRTAHEGKATLECAPADGSGPAVTITPIVSGGIHHSWSPDGNLVTFEQRGTRSGSNDLWLLRPGAPESGGKPRVWLESSFDKEYPQFSPDGKWIAYQSRESGTRQIYVQPAPQSDGPAPTAGKWQISTDGGSIPCWSRNSRELFYLSGERMMAVSVEPGPVFRHGSPRLLFEGRYNYGYDVAPDGNRFLMVQSEQTDTGAPQMHVVVNWFEELKRRAPVK
jgi:Tol biopolymer transport system component